MRMIASPLVVASCVALPVLWMQTGKAPVPRPSAAPPRAVAAAAVRDPALSGVAMSYDTFVDYRSSEDLRRNVWRRYSRFTRANLIVLDTVVRYRGHPTMKFVQPARSRATPRAGMATRGKELESFWLRVKVRWMPGYTTRGTSASTTANAYKFLGWGWRGYNQRGELAISNTDQYQATMSAIDPRARKTAMKFVWRSAGHAKAEWTDGQWYDYIVHVERTSDSTVRQRVWMARDGRTPKLRATIVGTMQPGYEAPTIRGVTLGLNFNQVRAREQYLWYGQWELVDGSDHANPFDLRDAE